MLNTEIVLTAVATSVPPASTCIVDPPRQFAGILDKLLGIKGQGYDWIRTYEIPGRKMLRKIVGETYAVFLSIEQSPERAYFYERLAGRLRADKVRMHADAPNSTLIVRTVFPTLDPSRISKYARSLDAAKAKGIKADLFEAFLENSGGFEKIRLEPIAVLVPGKAAKAGTQDSFKTVVPPVEPEDVDDLTDEEMDDLEFGDELYELLQHRKSTQLLAVVSLTAEQQACIDQSAPERLVFVGEIHGGELRIFDQVPFIEEAMTKAYRSQYPTCQDLRDAIG